MKVFDFLCQNGHRKELFVSDNTDYVLCAVCGSTAHRTVSAPNIQLEGVSGSFPGAAMKWERDHIERAKSKPLE